MRKFLTNLRRRWRNARSQARRKEETADEADRVAEINESEKVKRDTEAFLQQQAIEMENFAKEQKKKGVLMDDSVPIKLSAAAAQHPKPTSEQVEPSKPVLHKSAFNDEEVDENGMPMQKRKLVKLDYSGIVPDQDELTPEQREAARRVRLREIANGVSLDYVQLSKININWNAITDVVISKKLIPIAESLMKEYFGEADEEMLEVVSDQLKSHQGIDEFVETLEPVMLEDSKTAAIKIWRRLAFESITALEKLNTDNFIL